jgi:hypothetical protein
MTFLHKIIITNKYLKYSSFWWWWRLMSHEGFRFDDYYVWGEFWHSLSHGWEHMEYVNEFEKYWGEGSYPPEKIVLPQKDFDALVDRLNEPPQYDEKIAKLLTRKAPWDE